MRLQANHVVTFLHLIGVGKGTEIPGYETIPPSKLGRLQQELGWLRAFYLLMSHKLALCIVGKRLTYFRGDVRVELNPTWRILCRAVVARKKVIPIPRIRIVHPPLHVVSSALSLDENKEVHAKVGFNTAIVVFANLNGLPVVLHCATDDDSVCLINRHRKGVVTASSRLKGSQFEFLVPRFVDLKCAQSFACAQTQMVGISPNLKEVNLDGYNLHLTMALRWITDCHFLTFEPDSDPSMPALKLYDQDLFGHEKRLVNQVVTVVSKWSKKRQFGSVLVHGDYWLGNVLFHEKNRSISAVVDWEWCEESGLPGLDALQLVFMSRSRYSGTSFPCVLRDWFLNENPQSNDKNALKQICVTCQYDEHDLHCLVMYLWLDTLRRGCLETQPENSLWLHDILTIPLPGFIDWIQQHGDKCV